MAYDLRDLWQLDGYKVAETDTSGPPNYYGYLNGNGEWYIMKEAASAVGMSYTYARTGVAFATGWAGRALLTYAAFDVVF